MTTLDWIIIGTFLAISLTIGIGLRGKASGNISNFFLGGRNLPWWIAGTSMVATTFAADTPLLVTGIIHKEGISGNWIWWNMLIGGMLTTFFFAKYWRRAGLVTDVELTELRYNGKAAKFLRAFKAIYLGVFMNALIIGWVNFAFMKLLKIFFNVGTGDQLLYTGIAMVLVALYSSLSGLLGVAITDMVQFVIAMTGCIILATVILNAPEIGGVEGLKDKLDSSTFNFFPSLGGENIGTNLTISFVTFFSFVGMQWWASWYPGAEPGGGGYIAQRMMSAKNEKHAVISTLFFQIMHFCIRPWPWIVVGLCTIVIYPNVGEEAYVHAMNDYLPSGLKGLLLTAFLAAYMSTISTQFNWGASYLTKDLYMRFVRKEETFDSPKHASNHYVLWGRVFTVFIMIIALCVTPFINSIESIWLFLLGSGAGLGLVLILRWYWWRINVWSEIVATVIPLVVISIIKIIDYISFTPIREAYVGTQIPKEVIETYYTEYYLLDNPYSFFMIAAITTVSWIIATLLTKPESNETLIRFYKRIKPQGAWKSIRALGNFETPKNEIPHLLVCWISSIVLGYSILFLIGKLIFAEWNDFFISAITAAISFIILLWSSRKIKIFED